MPCINVHKPPYSPEMKGVGKLAAQVGFYAESIYVSSSAVHRKEGTQAEMAIELFPSWELTQLCSGHSRPRAGSVLWSQWWQLASAQLARALVMPPSNTKHMHVNEGGCERAGSRAWPCWLLPLVSAIASPAGKLLPALPQSCQVPMDGGGEIQSLRSLLLLCFSSLPYKIHLIFICLYWVMAFP